MTINETIITLEKLRDKYLKTENSCPKNLGCFHTIINALCQAISLLKELKWYRSQVFVDRKELNNLLELMKNEIRGANFDYNLILYKLSAVNELSELIYRLPIPEPPKE